MRKKKASYSKF